MTPSLSIRIDFPGGARLGPGKAALLAAIADTGSIAAAARALTMSYPRAWKLVEEMNTQLGDPLVAKQQGGAERGGAQLTAAGAEALALFRDIEAKAADVVAPELARLAQYSPAG